MSDQPLKAYANRRYSECAGELHQYARALQAPPTALRSQVDYWRAVCRGADLAMPGMYNETKPTISEVEIARMRAGMTARAVKPAPRPLAGPLFNRAPAPPSDRPKKPTPPAPRRAAVGIDPTLMVRVNKILDARDRAAGAALMMIRRVK